MKNKLFAVVLTIVFFNSFFTYTSVLNAAKGSPPVIYSFTANPTNISAGQSATLSWTVSGATSLSIDQGVGTVTGTSSIIVNPPSTLTYTLTARNSVGTRTASVLVTVVAPPPVATINLGYGDNATPTTIDGWAYSSTNGRGQSVAIVVENTANTQQTYTLSAQPTVARPDVENYLRQQYGSAITITQPLGFYVNPSAFISSPGTYRVRSITAQAGFALPLASSAQQNFIIASQPSNGRIRDLGLLITPKNISDFNNPAPSVRFFYDYHANLTSKADLVRVILSVGSGDHILNYATNSLNPPPPQVQTLFEDTVLPITPPVPGWSNNALALLVKDCVSGTKSYRIQVNNQDAKQAVFTRIFQEGQAPLLKDFGTLSWYWKKQGGTTIGFNILLRDRANGEEQWIGYYAGQTPPGASMNAWSQIYLGELPSTWRAQRVDLLQDAYTIFAYRSGGYYDYPQYMTARPWEVIGFAMAPIDGTAGFYDKIDAIANSGMTWNRNTLAYNVTGEDPYPHHRHFFAQKDQVYPQPLSYSQLKNIIREFKTEGQRRGLNVKVCDTMEAGPELGSNQYFKFIRHPEILIPGSYGKMGFYRSLQGDNYN